MNEELERKVQELVLEGIKKGYIKSAHDLSDGGVAVNIAESILNSSSNIGAKIDFDRKLRNDEMLFGECQSVIIVTIEADCLHKLILLAQGLDVYTQTIGRVNDTSRLEINDLINISRADLHEAYFNSLNKLMKV